jgi:hypothetical protein
VLVSAAVKRKVREGLQRRRNRAKQVMVDYQRKAAAEAVVIDYLHLEKPIFSDKQFQQVF